MRQIRVSDYLELPRIVRKGPPAFGRKEFYNFRNHVITTLGQFGTAGPVGLADLTVDEDDSMEFVGHTDNPDFFVVDDMYNEYDKISIVEADVIHISEPLLEAICNMALEFDGWRVSFSLGDSGLQIFGEKILVGGRRFWDCNSIADIAECCHHPVDCGPPPLPEQCEKMYPLWLAVISGEYTKAEDYAAPVSREWREALRLLEDIRLRRFPNPLLPSAYEWIRFDLHPDERTYHLQRYLQDKSKFSCERIANGERNIRLESAK